MQRNEGAKYFPEITMWLEYHGGDRKWWEIWVRLRQTFRDWVKILRISFLSHLFFNSTSVEYMLLDIDGGVMPMGLFSQFREKQLRENFLLLLPLNFQTCFPCFRIRNEFGIKDTMEITVSTMSLQI